MNESKIELVKLYNGDYIVGEGTGMESDNILKVELKNPRILALIPSASGITAALKPVCFPFTSKRLEEKIDIMKSQIMFRLFDALGEIEKEIINGYKSEVSGVKIATAAEAAAVANASNVII